MFQLLVILFLTFAGNLTSSLAWAADIKEARSEIYIIGDIKEGDQHVFHAVMSKYIGLVNKVIIYSRGGSVNAAVSIGRQIRFLELSTRPPTIGNPAMCLYLTNDVPFRAPPPTSSNTDANCTCTSACFLIWAGGVKRDPGTVGIHRPYYGKEYFGQLSSSEDAKTAYDRVLQRTTEYLKEMGVPDTLIDIMFSRSSEEMYFLNSTELRQLRGLPHLEEYELAKCGPKFDFYNNHEYVRAAMTPVGKLTARQKILLDQGQKYSDCIDGIRALRAAKQEEYLKKKW